MARVRGVRQRFIDHFYRAQQMARLRLFRRKSALQEAVIKPGALLAQQLQSSPHSVERLRRAGWIDAPVEKDGIRPPHLKVVLLRQLRQSSTVCCSASAITAHEIEHRREQISERARCGVREAGRPRFGLVHEIEAATDLAEHPETDRGVGHVANPSVVSEAERQVVVAARREQIERAL
jgi:hypothetical protein